MVAAQIGFVGPQRVLQRNEIELHANSLRL
jgi:hypothetical protein